MKSLISVALIACVPALALAGQSETQQAAQRNSCLVKQGRMVVTRYAQFKYQGYTKKHSFQVDCSVTQNVKNSSKSWFTIDAKSNDVAKVAWKPTRDSRDQLNIKCVTNDPLITGEKYNYTKEQVPTQSQTFETAVLLQDGGPVKLARLPAFSQQAVTVKGVDKNLDFITIQGRRDGKNFMLQLAGYSADLDKDAQEPHYTLSVSPQDVMDIDMSDVDSKACDALPDFNAQASWLPDGTIQNQAQ